jgi:hypothetical protein
MAKLPMARLCLATDEHPRVERRGASARRHTTAAAGQVPAAATPLLPFDAALARRPRQSCGRRRRWTLTSFSAPPSSIESADQPAGLLSAFLRRLAPSLASSSSCPGPSRLVGSLDSSPPNGSTAAAAALRSHKTYYLHPERKSPKVYGILLRLTRRAAVTDPF